MHKNKTKLFRDILIFSKKNIVEIKLWDFSMSIYANNKILNTF